MQMARRRIATETRAEPAWGCVDARFLRHWVVCTCALERFQADVDGRTAMPDVVERRPAFDYADGMAVCGIEDGRMYALSRGLLFFMHGGAGRGECLGLVELTYVGMTRTGMESMPVRDLIDGSTARTMQGVKAPDFIDPRMSVRTHHVSKQAVPLYSRHAQCREPVFSTSHEDKSQSPRQEPLQKGGVAFTDAAATRHKSRHNAAAPPRFYSPGRNHLHPSDCCVGLVLVAWGWVGGWGLEARSLV